MKKAKQNPVESYVSGLETLLGTRVKGPDHETETLAVGSLNDLRAATTPEQETGLDPLLASLLGEDDPLRRRTSKR